MKFTDPLLIRTTAKLFKKSIEQTIKDIIRKDHVVIFSMSHCEFSSVAKDIFWRMNKPFTAIELDQRKDGDEILAALGKLTGAATVPRVFIKGRFVGGATEVESLFYSGKLFDLIK